MRKLAAGLTRRSVADSPSDEEGPDFGDGPVRRIASPYQAMTEEDYLLWQTTSSLEALNLESLVAPYLTPMNTRMIRREEATAGFPRALGKSIAEHVREELARRPSAHVDDVVGTAGIALLREPLGPLTPTEERPNPFDGPAAVDALITPLPRRPPLQRRPTSFRGRREMPLYVQALRRNHQDAFIRTMMARIEEEAKMAYPGPPVPPEPHEPMPLYRRRRITIAPEQDPIPWLAEPDFAHWEDYRLDGPLSTPSPQEPGPMGEAPVIYRDSTGKTFI